MNGFRIDYNLESWCYQNMMCEVCGKVIKGKPHKVLIDGAVMLVCSSCARFGKEVFEENKSSSKGPITSSLSVVKPKVGVVKYKKKVERRSELSVEEVVEDFSDRIREALNKKGWKVSDLAKAIKEKESWLRKVEGGKVLPPIKVARKIEKVLGIKLLTKSIYVEEEIPSKEEGEVTFGDVVEFKKVSRKE